MMPVERVAVAAEMMAAEAAVTIASAVERDAERVVNARTAESNERVGRNRM
jgi:hypothetical protein